MNDRPSLVVGAVGDSITTAFNARNPSDNPSYSWATGDAAAFSSHAARLAGLYPTCDVVTANVAASGARARDLESQVARLALRAPDYVTLMVGANDLTDWLVNGEYGLLLDRFGNDVMRAVQ